MYRQSQGIRMDSSTAYQNTINSSQFLSRLVKLPVIDSAIGIATNIYGRAKNSGGFIGTTISIAENATFAAATQVVPYAQKFVPLASKPLTQLDDFASKGLEKLEANHPEIKKQPQQIVSDTKELINARVSPAVTRINSFSDIVLGTKFVQISLNIFESFLNTASSVVDHILPPVQSEKTAQQNGFHYDSSKNPEENRAGRLGFLFHKAIYLATSTTRRIINMAQSRVDTAASVSDSVRKSLNTILPASPKIASTPVVVENGQNAQNGDSKPIKNKTKKSQ